MVATAMDMVITAMVIVTVMVMDMVITTGDTITMAMVATTVDMDTMADMATEATIENMFQKLSLSPFIVCLSVLNIFPCL